MTGGGNWYIPEMQRHPCLKDYPPMTKEEERDALRSIVREDVFMWLVQGALKQDPYFLSVREGSPDIRAFLLEIVRDANAWIPSVVDFEELEGEKNAS